jgi:hypothetical protein
MRFCLRFVQGGEVLLSYVQVGRPDNSIVTGIAGEKPLKDSFGHWLPFCYFET